jgi:hypothetical protein
MFRAMSDTDLEALQLLAHRASFNFILRLREGEMFNLVSAFVSVVIPLERWPRVKNHKGS